MKYLTVVVCLNSTKKYSPQFILLAFHPVETEPVVKARMSATNHENTRHKNLKGIEELPAALAKFSIQQWHHMSCLSLPPTFFNLTFI